MLWQKISVNKYKNTRWSFGLTGKRPELRESLGITAETNISAIAGNVSNTTYFEAVIFSVVQQQKWGVSRLNVEVPRSHTTSNTQTHTHTTSNTHTHTHTTSNTHTHTHSIGLIWAVDQLVAEAATFTAQNKQSWEHPCPQEVSKPRSQQSSSRILTAYTSRSSESAASRLLTLTNECTQQRLHMAYGITYSLTQSSTICNFYLNQQCLVWFAQHRLLNILQKITEISYISGLSWYGKLHKSSH